MPLSTFADPTAATEPPPFQPVDPSQPQITPWDILSDPFLFNQAPGAIAAVTEASPGVPDPSGTSWSDVFKSSVSGVVKDLSGALAGKIVGVPSSLSLQAQAAALAAKQQQDTFLLVGGIAAAAVLLVVVMKGRK